MLATGARVRNAYATYPQQGDNGVKIPLIPRIDTDSHVFVSKAFGRLWTGMRGIR